MNGWTNKSPPVFYRTSSPLGPLPKKRKEAERGGEGEREYGGKIREQISSKGMKKRRNELETMEKLWYCYNLKFEYRFLPFS